MDLIAVLTIIGIAVANIGTTITLFTWSTNHSAEDRRSAEARLDRSLNGIRDEMKDFHSRLEKQDADFKTRMCVIDSEFKTRLCIIEENRNIKTANTK
jgi:hypothetical protein